jgi:hypothetical protein
MGDRDSMPTRCDTDGALGRTVADDAPFDVTRAA